jgi:flavodoxin
MSTIYGIVIAAGVAFAAILCYLVAVSLIERHQAGRVRDKVPYASPSTPRAGGVAVVYFSRSGNTALAARHVARRLEAPLYTLNASAYRLGLSGLVKATKDANARRSDPAMEIDISPRIIDLTPFDTVYLGSPVWLYSPAPPIWTFVEHNRFDGMSVVLFNTHNSHIGDDHIAAMKAMVMTRGAKAFEHRHIVRGRMLQQMSAEEMLRAIDAEWFNSPRTGGLQR